MTFGLSIVIAAFKDSPFLDSCVQSLLNQTIHCQVLIATSTPSPHIDHVAEAHNVPVILNPYGGSISRDWNFALKQGEYPLIVIAHQDDLYESRFAEKILSCWQSDPGWLMAFTDHKELMVDSARPDGLNLRIKRLLIERAFFRHSVRSGPEVRRKLLGWGNPISCPSVALNRNALADFRFSDEWEVNLDWDAWERICQRQGKIAYIRDQLVHHRVHPNSETSASIKDNRRYREDLLMFQKFWPKWISRLLIIPYRVSYKSNFE